MGTIIMNHAPITDYQKTAFQALTLNGSHKGAPHSVTLLPFSAIGQQNWNVLHEDFPLPLAVLKSSKIKSNIQWMSDYLKYSGVQLAPHGKTTLAPQLFQLQLDNGAWGMTLANIHQVRVARRFGINKILMANQLIGKQACHYIINTLKEDPDFEFYCLIDHADNVNELCDYAQQMGLHDINPKRRINVLIEIGMSHGRTGIIGAENALSLAQAIAAKSDYLSLKGVECYEGVIHEDNPQLAEQKVVHFLEEVLAIAQQIETRGYFDSNTERLILSAGGTAYYDLVARVFTAHRLVSPCDILIRSGCYLAHDAGIYQVHQQCLLERDTTAAKITGELQPALEVWAYVQSLPEAGVAILTLGKRDVSFDAGLPLPTQWIQTAHARHAVDHHQPHIVPLDARYCIFDVNDQHAFMRYPTDALVKVGDIITMDISHPCLTFDKWQVIPVVNDRYDVVDMIQTFF